jgi:hypothetical protein
VISAGYVFRNLRGARNAPASAVRLWKFFLLLKFIPRLDALALVPFD